MTIQWEIRRLLRRLWYRWIYLHSPHWRKFSQEVRGTYRWKCQYITDWQKVYQNGNRKTLAIKCLSPASDVHHLNYNHLGRETLEDVTLLCRYHHNREHKGKRK